MMTTCAFTTDQKKISLIVFFQFVLFILIPYQNCRCSEESHKRVFCLFLFNFFETWAFVFLKNTPYHSKRLSCAGKGVT